MVGEDSIRMTHAGKAATAIEELHEMYESRNRRTLQLGLLILAFFWVGLILFLWSFLSLAPPGSLPLSAVGRLVLVTVLAPFLLWWAGGLDVLFRAFRAVPLRLTEEGIEMPTLPFREWLVGKRAHFVQYENLRVVRFFPGQSGGWWITLAEKNGRRHRFAGSWFGERKDVAFLLLRQRLPSAEHLPIPRGENGKAREQSERIQGG